MGIIGLSDPSGAYEAVVFSEGLQQYRDMLEPGSAVLLTLSAELQGDEVRARIQTAEPLEEAVAKHQKGMRIFLRDERPISTVQERLKLRGEGERGAGGGPPGDLYVVVTVAPDERFLRDGDDLVTVLDVAAPLAMLGATLSAPALEGEVDVEIPAGTQPGEVFVVRGEGMPRLRRPGRRGDLRVVVNVVVPRRLTREQRRQVEKLADSLTHENVHTDESLVGKLKRLIGAS
jgi:DnaJ-class molecular chaperone